MKKAVIQVETGHCPSCLVKIQARLEHQSGVEQTNIYPGPQKIVVKFSDNEMTVKRLKEIVEETGYAVTKITTT